MMNLGGINIGGVAAIAAALLGLFLWGRSSGKKSNANDLAKEKAETEKLKAEQKIGEEASRATVKTAYEQGQAKSDFDNKMRAIEKAKEREETEKALDIALETAKKAIDKGASKK